MSLVKNQQPAEGAAKTTVPRDRFIIEGSECYFEAAQYLTGKLDEAKVKSLFANEQMSVEETEGKSLKVMFATGNEIKFTGFITAGDASLELSKDDIDTVMDHAKVANFTRAINADALVDMF